MPLLQEVIQLDFFSRYIYSGICVSKEEWAEDTSAAVRRLQGMPCH